jgi:hypothetical protein
MTSLAAAAILSMPMAASALEKMDNTQLKAATGQAGVSIAIDDIVIYQSSLADTTYWDIDGVNAGDGAAGIMIDHADQMQKLMVIDGILDDTKYGTTALGNIFGTSNIGIISQSDLAGLRTTISEYVISLGNQDSADFAANGATIATNQAIIDEGVGGANGYVQADIDAATAARDTAIADNTTIANNNMAAYVAAHGATGYDTAVFDATNGNTANDDYRTGISPLTIDVGTCEALTKGWEYNMGDSRATIGSVGGVVIGLPTIEIETYTNSDFKSVKFVAGTANADGTVTTGAAGYMNEHHNTMITIEKSGNSTLAILGGRLEIAPH